MAKKRSSLLKFIKDGDAFRIFREREVWHSYMGFLQRPESCIYGQKNKYAFYPDPAIERSPISKKEMAEIIAKMRKIK